eukprot:809104-Pelagomonas_calceolata.AAC.5
MATLHWPGPPHHSAQAAAPPCCVLNNCCLIIGGWISQHNSCKRCRIAQQPAAEDAISQMHRCALSVRFYSPACVPHEVGSAPSACPQPNQKLIACALVAVPLAWTAG